MNTDWLATKKAVVFDMDGLLIDSEPFWQLSEKEVFAAYGVTITEQDLKDSMGLKNTEVVHLMINRYQLPLEWHAEICTGIENTVSAKIKTHGKLLPGVEEMIERCASHPLKIALATSSSHLIINTVLDTFGLRDAFKIICSAYDETYGKPHPAVFLRALEKLEEPSYHCFVLEDSVNGVIAAKAAKLYTIAIPDPHDFENPKFAIADLKCLSLIDCSQKIFSK